MYNYSKFIVLAGLLGFLAFQSTASYAAYCFEPPAPSLFISKPSKPYCASTRSCTDWEVQSYKSEVDRYFRKLKQYLGDVDSYYGEAYDYAKCMADLD